jgi:trichohyalin
LFAVEYFDYDAVTTADDFGDIESFLERSQERERQRIEEMLQEIDKHLAETAQIHTEVIDDLESKLDWYVDRLETHYQRGTGQRDGERDDLKERIEQFYKELRREKRQRWQDKQELASERRRVCRELAEMTAGSELIELLERM